MKYARTVSFSSLSPFEVKPIIIEATFHQGLPAFHFTGVPPALGKSIMERVRAALRSCEVALPLGVITLNFSPADVKKEGAHLDLPVAVAILDMLGMLREDIHPAAKGHEEGSLFAGELSLAGELSGNTPILPAALAARDLNISRFFVSGSLLPLTAPFSPPDFYPVRHLQELIDPDSIITPIPYNESEHIGQESDKDNDERGKLLQTLFLAFEERRAIEIAVAGWHSILFVGPPGTGKSSLAREAASLLPLPDRIESVEIQSIDMSDLAYQELSRNGKDVQESGRVLRKVRIPHHSITVRGLVGGGSRPRIGEVTRAHHGVLILDELAEFNRSALQSLREPFETGGVHIVRGTESLFYPARFLLMATTNPCPCGNAGTKRECICSLHTLRSYRSKIIGPLRDRIDIELFVNESPKREQATQSEIDEMLARIDRAREIQRERYRSETFRWNGEIPVQQIDRFAKFEDEEGELLWQVWRQKSSASRRGAYSVRRLARSIADLAGSPDIRKSDIEEALVYRCLDSLWS